MNGRRVRSIFADAVAVVTSPNTDATTSSADTAPRLSRAERAEMAALLAMFAAEGAPMFGPHFDCPKVTPYDFAPVRSVPPAPRPDTRGTRRAFSSRGSFRGRR